MPIINKERQSSISKWMKPITKFLMLYEIAAMSGITIMDWINTFRSNANNAIEITWYVYFGISVFIRSLWAYMTLRKTVIAISCKMTPILLITKIPKCGVDHVIANEKVRTVASYYAWVNSRIEVHTTNRYILHSYGICNSMDRQKVDVLVLDSFSYSSSDYWALWFLFMGIRLWTFTWSESADEVWGWIISASAYRKKGNNKLQLFRCHILLVGFWGDPL